VLSRRALNAYVRPCAGPRQRQLHVARPGSRPPPPSPPDPDPLSQRDAPSLIAARHTEAICSNEARRHGDAVRLFGFAVDCPAEK